MKLSDLGRGAHLQIRKLGNVWRATLRINADHRGSGIQIANVNEHPGAAVADVASRAAQAIEILGCPALPGTSEALAVAHRMGCASMHEDLSGYADAFEDETLAQLAGTLARAAAKRHVSEAPITLIGDIGWRGGGRASAFGARRPFVQRYSRGRRRPAGHGVRRHPYHGPYHAPHAAPWPVAPYPYGYPYPTDEGSDPGQDPGTAPAPDASDDSPAAPASDVPTPAAPMRGKHRHHHGAPPADPNAPDGWDVQDIVLQAMQAGQPPPAAGA
jgi:hypothetical protein